MYNRELEYEYDTFEDWLHTFNLYRGKCSDDADVEQNAADEDRLIGKFKVCRHPLPNAMFSLLFLHVHLDTSTALLLLLISTC